MPYPLRAPSEAGIDLDALTDLRGRVAHALTKGPLPSIQIALARHRQLVYFETFGEATNSTRYNVFSCTKPLVASALWLLMGQGRVDITQPVAHYLEQFTGGGKEAVTVEQVLCHISGFPEARLHPSQWWDSDSRLRAMREWQLEWQPGSKIVYHALSAHWVLAELISQVTGIDYRSFIHNYILKPLDIAQLRLGVPEDEQADIATLCHVGEPPNAQEMEKLFGSAIDWPDTRDDFLLKFNEPAVRALGVPGGGAIGTAADLAMFYQGILANPEDLWQPDVLANAIGEVWVDLPDPLTGCPAHRGLGVVIAGSGKYQPYRGMGDKVSRRAFGHQGVGGQVAWGDPETGLSFCMLTNGLDANPLRSAQFCAAVNNRAGSCVQR